MAFGSGNTGGFLKLAPLARSVSPRYGVLKGIGSTNTSIAKPKGINIKRPGAAVTGAPNIKSPLGKSASIPKLGRM